MNFTIIDALGQLRPVASGGVQVAGGVFLSRATLSGRPQSQVRLWLVFLLVPEQFGGISGGMRGQVCRLTLAAQLLSSLKNCFEPFPVNQVQQLLRGATRSLIADLPLTHRR